MPDTNRCLKYGGVHETVPRHECALTSDEVDCEFDYIDRLYAEVMMWKELGIDTDHSERKLKFALERRGMS